MQTQTHVLADTLRAVPIINRSFAKIHELPPLPYGFTALEPIISEETLWTHYSKHHKGYIDELNKLVVGTRFAGMSLVQVMLAAANKPQYQQVYDNAAQAWNHDFYWRSLKPQGGGDTSATLQSLIHSFFGDTKSFKHELVKASAAQFGSGWVWLVMDHYELKIVSTSNAGNVLVEGLTPLLVIDVWEHAYYLDFQNRRVDYVAAVLDNLINWEFATDNLRQLIVTK